MKNHTLYAIRYTLIVFFILSLTGCEAFVRKFTRKSKKKDLQRHEMVLAPEEYKGPEISKEELYRQNFLFWKSWQDELISSLESNIAHNRKKQLDCIQEAIKNLQGIRPLLIDEKKSDLDSYLSKMSELEGFIENDMYGSNRVSNRFSAEQLKRNILKKFSYDKMAKYLL